MKRKYLLIIALMLIQYFSYAQCNYGKSLIAYCSSGYVPKPSNYSLKISVQMGNDFLYAGTIKCSSSVYMNKAEFVLANFCGETIVAKKEEYTCDSSFCVDDFKLFPHSSDTAWLVQTGKVFKLFKVTRQLSLIPVINFPVINENIVSINQMPNGNIVLLCANSATSLIKVYKSDGVKLADYNTSPKASNGFWISNFFDKKLIGHSINNPNKFLEIKLNNDGLILSDTIVMNSPKTLYPNLYCFSEEIPGEPLFVSIAEGSQVGIYPVIGQTVGVAKFTQETFVEKGFTQLESLKVLDGGDGDLLLQASPETYLWTKDGNLITCIPSKAYRTKPGSSSASVVTFWNQGIHVSKQAYPFPGNSIVHISGTSKGFGGGYYGQPVEAGYSGFTCYTRALTDSVILTGMPDTIKKFPYHSFVSVSLTNPSPWDVEWVANKNVIFNPAPTVSGTLKDFNIKQSDLNGPFDSVRVCVVAYYQGSTPLKKCKKTILGEPSVPIGLSDKLTEPNQSLKIFPNPANAIFNLTAEPELIGSNWELYSSTGILVQEGKLQASNTLDISMLATGVYCLKVKSTHGNFNYRLVSLNYSN
ncbi:MAG: T9SS type A sorting domain-containing protein [Bacteroidia bacterium]|jgi:hypothetical protein|nr:T9SS type A sorting domain-containing protein [Bacteroidia bacterium]